MIWQTYVADTNGALVISLASLGGKETELKLYSEMVERKKPSPTDGMTAEQIKQRIIDKL